MTRQLSNVKSTPNVKENTHKPFTHPEKIVKRTMDIVGGLVGTFLFSIVYIILCPFYWFQSKDERGPIIYTQTRFGKIDELWIAKPGITGHWTTNGRSKILFPQRAKLELMYNHKHGFIYDVKCLLITVNQIFRGEDAY